MADTNLSIKDLGDGLFLFGDHLICSEKSISSESKMNDDGTAVIRSEYSRFYIEHTFTVEMNNNCPKITSHSWKRIYKENVTQ